MPLSILLPFEGLAPLKVSLLTSRSLAIQNPAELEDWLGDLNPHSKEVIKDAYAVPSLATAVLGDKFQFERLGNFRAREFSIYYVIQWVFTTQLIVLL